MKKFYIFLLGFMLLGHYSFSQNYYSTDTKKVSSFGRDRIIIRNSSSGDIDKASTNVLTNMEAGSRSDLCTENLYESGCELNGLNYWSLQNVTVPEIPCTGEPAWYHDYTNMGHNLQAGQTYALTVQTDEIDTFFDVWIDFDDDLQLTEEELVLNDAHIVSPGQVSTFDITIPEDAMTGSHIMRVRTNAGTVVSDPCETYSMGNCCDFTATFGTSTLCDPPSNVEMIPSFKEQEGFIPYAGFRWTWDTTGLIDN
jgi:hypothetical protein